MGLSIEDAHKYRADAAADGWDIEATYGTHETIDRAWKARKEGFVIQAIARPADGRRRKDDVSIHIWGPDGLAISPPPAYDMKIIEDRVRYCKHCGTKDVETQRVGFAGRVCSNCLPALREKVEYPGWTR